MGEMALEERLVGENAEAGGTVCFVDACDGDGVEVARRMPAEGEAFLTSAMS